MTILYNNLISILKQAGYELNSTTTKGSHRKWEHPYKATDSYNA